MAEDRPLPNDALRLLFLSIEEVMGKDGMKAVLHGAKMSQYINNYPPKNLNTEVHFSDYGKAEQAVEDFYGPRGAKAMLSRIGRGTFQYALREQSAVLGLAGEALKKMPLLGMTAKMKLFLQQMVAAANKTVNLPQHLEETNDAFVVVTTECPCQHRPAHTQACCAVSVGTYVEAMKWLTDKQYTVTEITCLNKGDDACRYRIPKEAAE
jgi:predicted hydrocarbon binding protein